MNKVVLVTGGSRGIGAACALLAGRQGYKVCVNYNSNQAKAEDVVGQIETDGGTAIAVQADVSQEVDVNALFGAIDKQLGELTSLVNNAGIVRPLGPIAQLNATRLNELWATNLTGMFLCAREAVKRMSSDGHGKGGAIVNMSSVAARLGGGGQFLDYAASKGAIDTLTHGLAQEVAAQGIRVNAVRPGLIDTEIHADFGTPNRVAELGPTVPMGRSGSAEEVADAVLWLLSPASGYVTGTFIDVSGGR